MAYGSRMACRRRTIRRNNRNSPPDKPILQLRHTPDLTLARVTGIKPAGSRVSNAKTATEYLDYINTLPNETKLVSDLGSSKAVVIRNKSTNETTEIHGSKDAQGFLVEVQKSVYIDPAGKATTAEYGANGAKTFSDDKGILVLTPQSNGKWEAKLTERSTGNSAIALVDSAAPASAPKQMAMSTVVDIQKSLTPKLLASTASSVNKITVNVTTTSCGVQGDPNADINVHLRSRITNSVLESTRAVKVGTGQYRAELPNPTAQAPISMEWLRDSLSAVDTAVGLACRQESQAPGSTLVACESVVAGLVLTGGGIPAAVGVSSLCVRGTIAVNSTCAARSAIPALPTPEVVKDTGFSTPSLTSSFIKNIDDISPQIEAVADTIPPTLGESVGWSGNSTSPTVNLKLDIPTAKMGEIMVTPLTYGQLTQIEPSIILSGVQVANPNIIVGATATVEVSCMSRGYSWNATVEQNGSVLVQDSKTYTGPVKSDTALIRGLTGDIIIDAATDTVHVDPGTIKFNFIIKTPDGGTTAPKSATFTN